MRKCSIARQRRARGNNIILPGTIRRAASSFDIPEVKHAISIDNKWSEPLVLICNLGVGDETPDYPAHSTLLNVNDGYPQNGHFVWKMHSAQGHRHDFAFCFASFPLVGSSFIANKSWGVLVNRHFLRKMSIHQHSPTFLDF